MTSINLQVRLSRIRLAGLLDSYVILIKVCHSYSQYFEANDQPLPSAGRHPPLPFSSSANHLPFDAQATQAQNKLRTRCVYEACQV